MPENAEIQTPNGQLQLNGLDGLSAAEQQIIERVLALSLQEQSTKPARKSNGLKEKHLKLLANMKMTKSSQKCTICYSDFCQAQIIKKLPCKHIFHRACAKSWFKINHNCPNCRFDLEEHFSRIEAEGKLATEAPSQARPDKLESGLRKVERGEPPQQLQHLI